jgi:plastocyanin
VKRSPLHIASLALVFVTLCAPIACGNGAEDAGSATNPTAPAATDHSTHDPAADGASVEMSLIAYKPETLTVPVATSVSWTQKDAGKHTVTSGSVEQDASGSVATEPDDVFDSGELETGETFEFTFDERGTYPYFCAIHPATMQGSITVE